MRVAVGKVVGGKIALEGEPLLEEGATVTILAREGTGTFDLDVYAEARLLEAITEADRGDLVDAEELFRELRREGEPSPFR